MAAKRAGWHELLAGESPAQLVFVDESGANTRMTRWRGRTLAGQRLVAQIPHGHYQTSTLIAGVRLGGACAPWLFDGAMDGELFLAWVRQGLVPVLQTGDLVIMDNLATHKVAGVREATLFARLQPHRKHVEQDQAGAAQPVPADPARIAGRRRCRV